MILGGLPAAELGIDLGGILRRTRGVLIGRLRGPDMEELDVGGPLLFSAILGASHLVVSGFWVVCRIACVSRDTPSLERDTPSVYNLLW